MQRKWQIAFLILLCSFFPAALSGKVTLVGQDYISVQEIASKFKLQAKWIKSQEQVKLYNKSISIQLTKEKRPFLLNDTLIWLGKPVTLHKGKLYVSVADFEGTLVPLLSPKSFGKKPKQPKHIVIDAGHGGKDNGTSNKAFNVHEKEMTLDVSLRLKKILQGQGYKVTLTRSTDHQVPLKERPLIANKKKADLFISVHFNSVTSGAASVEGIETYALTLKGHPSSTASTVSQADQKINEGNKSDPWNAMLGYSVHSSVTSAVGANDRGIKRARFAVLRTLKCPGILVEAGFVSNPKECRLIKTAAHRDKLAQGIAKGVVNYHKMVNKLYA